MKKSFLFVLLLAVLTFACSAVFVACDTQTADEHTLTHVEAADATCTEDGNTEYWVCSDCGKYFSDENATTEISQSDTVIPATGHSYGEWTTVKNATCTEDGTRERECTVCHEKEQETVSATGHTFSDDWSGDDNYHWHDCINCDEVKDKAEHTWDDGVVTKQPTCTENGVMTYTCTVCEKTKTADIPATGHTFSEDWSYDDTYHWHAATCGDTDEVIGKAEHTWDDGVVTKQPTCTENGVMTYTCTVCEKTKTADIPATGHTFSEDWSYDDTYHWHAATCGDTDEVSAKAEHIWVNGVCSVCGTPQPPSEGLEYELNNDGTAYSVSGIGSCADTVIVIPSVYNGLPVTSIGRYAFYGCSSLTSVTIPDSVKSIGEGAFQYCTALTNVYISDIATWCNISFANDSSNPLKNAANLYINGKLVTELIIPDDVTSIGNYQFSNFTSLTSITIPDSVTSIGEGAFQYCSSLTSITIPDSVTSIGEKAFYMCSTLESITLPFTGARKNGTSNTHFGYIFGASSYSNISLYVPESLKSVTITGNDNIESYAFSDCSSLKSITIGSGVTSIGQYAFYGCSSLTSITIPESVTSIEYNAFYNCTAIENVYITDIAAWCNIDFTTYESNPLYYSANLYLNDELVTELIIPDGVTSIGYVFYNCKSLTSVTIPDSVTSIDTYAFYNCSSLTSIDIPDSVVSIGAYAFYGCSSLTSIDIPDSVVSIGAYAFYGCSSLTSITIPERVTSIGESAFYYCKSLTSINIPDNVTSIGGYAFYGCSSLTSVNIPAGVTSIGNYAFYSCYSLTSITIPESVTSIGSNAFYSCYSLTSITVPGSVTSIGSYAFGACYKLVEVYNLSSLDLTMGSYENGYVAYYALNVYTDMSGQSYLETTDDGYVFYDDGESVYLIEYKGTQTELTLPDNFNGKDYQIYKYAFYYCSSLKSIAIPDSVTSIGTAAFRNCTSLTSVNIPAGVTSIGDSAFRDCSSLTSITIPDSVTSIDTYAFYNCSSLTSIDIPDSVVSIGAYAFYGCSSLTSITIPDSVTSIGSYAFYNCSSLTSITIPDSVTFIGQYAFRNCTSLTSVTFENTSGWWISTSSTATSGTDISSEDLADPATAATYLVSTYYNKYWHRS